MNSDPHAGIVSLVGAGPGDPQLLTLRGRELLEHADVVLHDHLANPRLLDYCPHAETVFVGKRAGETGISQARINELLIDYARQGKRVVRLKGGDPFLFGRGAEECEALAAAGVRFEVAPGITAALGAAAYAGIPLTHRALGSSVTFVTAHGSDDQRPLDFETLAKLPCIVFYMGVKTAPHVCDGLIRAGLARDTPAAVVQDATLPTQRTITGTIETIAAQIAQHALQSPALILVGKQVELRDTIQWFERRPLFGKTIVVTRARAQAGELSARLEALGATVIESPAIELRPPKSFDAVDRALRDAGSYDWIVFTSPAAAHAVRARMDALRLDARSFKGARIAAIGHATSEALRRELFINVDLAPQRFVSEALAEALARENEIAGRSFLLLRADIARVTLETLLQAGGAARVEAISIYETHPIAIPVVGLIDKLRERKIEWITFTSASAVESFLRQVEDRSLLQSVKLASIGLITTAALQANGLHVTIEARRSDLSGLIEAITEASAADARDA